MHFALDNLLLFALFAAAPSSVDAHGYAKSPRSRNWLAHQDGKSSSSGTASDPQQESCHHCLNQGDTAQDQVCGIANDSGNDYNFPKNALGGPLAPVMQAEYTEGDIIIIESVLTSHHQGHQEVKACPYPNALTQDCFDTYPLEFVDDLLYGAPKDVNYPERGYFAPNDGSAEGPGSYSLDTSWGMAFAMRFKLPEGVGLFGDHVVLQWHYLTGNSCRHKGYDVYPWPSGWAPDNMGFCPDPLPTNGANVPPEQFWNCMDVKILPAAPTISPAPSLPPVPTATPSAAPISTVMCCSQNFIECVPNSWNQNTQEVCEAANSAWITLPTSTCTPRWDSCTTDAECCYPGYCKDGNHCELDPNAEEQMPAPTPTVPSPTPPAPTPPTNTGEACCTLNYKDCHQESFCNANIDQCLNECDKTWLPDGPLEGCTPLWDTCLLDSDCCHTGVCIDNHCAADTSPAPAPTVPSPTPPSPTPPSTPTEPVGCYSNNYKDCIPDNLLSADDSHYKTWLPNGDQENCVALWGECTGQPDSCCEPAQCFGDNSHAACVPPDGCYSNNYKDCIPDNLVSNAGSYYKIWLPTGSETNCIALWDECTGQPDSCCGPAQCFGDEGYAACVPYSDALSA